MESEIGSSGFGVIFDLIAWPWLCPLFDSNHSVNVVISLIDVLLSS
jgi:hypothetical protein